MPTLAPGQTKVTTRVAEKNAQAQTDALATRLNSTQREFLGNDVPTNIKPGDPGYSSDFSVVKTTSGAGPQGYVAPVSPSTSAPDSFALGKIDESAITRLMGTGLTREEAIARTVAQKPVASEVASNTGLGGTFNNTTGQFIPVPLSAQDTSHERVAANATRQQIADLSKPASAPAVYDAKGNIIKSAAQATAELNAARAEQAASLQKQLTEQQARQAAKQAADAAAAATGAPMTAGGDATIPTAPTVGADKAVTDAKAQLDARLSDINAPSPGQINEADALATAKTNLVAKLDAADALEKIQKDRALEKERNDLSLNDRAHELANIENTKSQLDQVKLNTDNEIKNRRIINKLSGGHDFSGLQWVQKQVQNGVDALNYLRQKAANMEGLYADKAISIINDYGLDLSSAEQNKKSIYAQDYSDYTNKLDDIRKELRLDNQKKMELRDKAHADYSKILTDRDFKYGDFIKELYIKAQDRMWSVEDRQVRSRETAFSQGIAFMNMLDNKNIRGSTATLEMAEKMMGLPQGTLDIIRSGGNGGGVAGFTSDQVDEARLAWFAQYHKLPPKDELPTMVATYFHTRTLVRAGQSTEKGESPDVYSNPFEEMRMMDELGTSHANYEQVKKDGSYKGTFLDFLKDTRSPLFSLPSLGSLAPQDGSSSSGSAGPGLTPLR